MVRRPTLPVLRSGCGLFIAAAAATVSPKTETLDYACTIGALTINIHADLPAKSVTQQVASGPITLTAEYMDGVFGKVADSGPAARIPAMHQFVRISDESIVYGGELDGAKEAAVLDRHMSTLTLANGQSGWCISLPSGK